MTVTTTATRAPEPRTAPTTRCAGECGARLPLSQQNPAPGCDDTDPTTGAGSVFCDECLDLHLLGCTACTRAVRYDAWME